MITVYTKDYCPYCVQAKNLLSSLGFSYTEEDITHNEGKMMEIAMRSQRRTVPQVFVNDVFLGGYSDMVALHEEGELISTLERMLQAE